MSQSPTYFSNINRTERIDEAVLNHFDVIIIGGGVTGAGIALDASLRKKKVLLLEKKDFASGTSSKSTKLIHGGLRYLKNLEIGLVRETGIERYITHKNICHLVHPEKMLLPIVEGGSFNIFSANMAIGLYDFLAKVPMSQRKKKLNKSQSLLAEPLLDAKILKSSIQYAEYRTDDARLSIEIIKAAVRNGATAFNYLKVEDFIYEASKVYGVICEDVLNGQKLKFTAKHVINAAGPWVDELRAIENPDTELNLHLTKGVHIVFNRSDFKISSAIYFDAFDGRMIFAIPRGSTVYVGTTDTTFKEDKDELNCTLEDAKYLLNAVNGFFDMDPLNVRHIIFSWTGIRPLIQKRGKSPSELSRKDEIFISNSGLISIAGGKLTGYRKMAERVVNKLFKNNNENFVRSSTKHYQIHHQPFIDYASYKNYIKDMHLEYQDLSLSISELEDLVSTFGKDASLIIHNAFEMLKNNSKYNFQSAYLESLINYAVDFESAAHPMDFLNRRTGWTYFNLPKAKSNLGTVNDVLKDRLGYTTQFSKGQLIEAEKDLEGYQIESNKTF